MVTNNRFFVLASSLFSQASNYSYDLTTGEQTVVVDNVKGFYRMSINARTGKKAFMLASDVVFTSAQVVMFNGSTYIGYETVQANTLCELNENTTEFGVNIATTQSSSDTTKIWFYAGFEVFPHYKKLEKKYNKETNQMFFRETLDGQIKLIAEDYEYVKSMNLEQNMVFAIYKSGVLYSKSVFNKTDCKFDRVKRIVELKLKSEDKYTNILNGYDRTYDLIKLAPSISRLILSKRLAYQIYIQGSNSYTTVANGAYWEDDVNEVIDNADRLRNEFYFANLRTFYEIHLDGFNYDINATYVMDGSSVDWPATSRVVVNGVTYEIDAYIHLEKIASAGEVSNIGDTAHSFSRDRAMQVTTRVGEFDVPFLLYDIYKIQIFQGRPDGSTGTPDKIYESRNYYVNDNTDGSYMLRSGGEGNFEMVAVPHDVPMRTPTPSTFNLGDNIIEYGVWARIVCDVDQVTVGDTTYTLYDLPRDDFAYPRANYRKCIGLLGLTLWQSRATSSVPTKYGMDDYGYYFTSNFLGYSSMIYGKPIPVCRSTWANTSIWVTFNENWATSFENKFRCEHVLKDAYSLADVISAFLKKLDSSITHEAAAEYSEFLYSGNSPLQFDTARNGYSIYISPKSNVLKGNYDQAAQKAELTFENLMNMLKDCFRCYWFIDNNNRFRIEHVSYFMKGMSYSSPVLQMDLTNRLDKFNKKQALYSQQELSFEKSELTSRYEFAWADDCTDLFGNNTLSIKSKYIEADKNEDISVDNFSSDVDLMLMCPDKFNYDGFALLIANSTTGKVPIGATVQFKDNEYYYPYNASPQNFLASWLYLMRYYSYDYPASTVEYDGIESVDAMRCKGVKRCMEHVIEYPAGLTEPDVYKLIKTEVGNGYVEDVSINIDTELAKVTLTYEPE